MAKKQFMINDNDIVMSTTTAKVVKEFFDGLKKVSESIPDEQKNILDEVVQKWKDQAAYIKTPST